jgi:hypothetical protein
MSRARETSRGAPGVDPQPHRSAFRLSAHQGPSTHSTPPREFAVLSPLGRVKFRRTHTYHALDFALSTCLAREMSSGAPPWRRPAATPFHIQPLGTPGPSTLASARVRRALSLALRPSQIPHAYATPTSTALDFALSYIPHVEPLTSCVADHPVSSFGKAPVAIPTSQTSVIPFQIQL